MKYTFLIFICLLIFSSCNSKDEKSKNEEKITVHGTEIYYSDGVTIEQAKKLGSFLRQNQFTDGTHKTVQFLIDQNTKNLTFRMVTSKGTAYNFLNDQMFENFVRTISKEFEKEIDLELCDKSFKTLRSINFEDIPKLKMVKETQLFYTNNITDKTLNKLADYLIEKEEANDYIRKTIYVDYINDTVLYKVVINPGYENDTVFVKTIKDFSGQLSENVFYNKPVQPILCDRNRLMLKKL